MSDANVPETWVRQIAEEVTRRLAGEAAAASERSAPPAASPGGYGETSSSGGGGGYGDAPPGGGSGGYDSAPGSCGPQGCRVPGFENGHDADRFRLLVEYGVARVGCLPGVGAVDKELAAMIDHTQLKPEATERDIVTLCEEAHCHGFATVCVQPIWVPVAHRVLENSPVRVCTVIGFPHGANRAEVKAYETQVAVAQGAREVDMVIPIGALKGGDTRTVGRHVAAVVGAAIPGVIVKVIIENTFLNDDEKRIASKIVKEEGAHFVKTSTGFGPSGATLDDVRLMREVVGANLGVKAAGGIRDTDAARRMVEAGATRIGASASIQIAGS